MLTDSQLVLDAECASKSSTFSAQYYDLDATNANAIQVIATSSLMASVLQFLQLESCVAMLEVSRTFNKVVVDDSSTWRTWSEHYFGQTQTASVAKSAKVDYFQKFMGEVRRCNGLPDRFTPSPTMKNITISENMRTAVNTSQFRLGSILCDGSTRAVATHLMSSSAAVDSTFLELFLPTGLPVRIYSRVTSLL